MVMSLALYVLGIVCIYLIILSVLFEKKICCEEGDL